MFNEKVIDELKNIINSEKLKGVVEEALASLLWDVYVCNRVWDAWNYGTMSKDDFSLIVDDDDIMKDISQHIIEVFSSEMLSNITQEGIGEFEKIDWNEISKRGLLKRINSEIMHPIGLAIYRDDKTGMSGGALISPDGVWKYE